MRIKHHLFTLVALVAAFSMEAGVKGSSFGIVNYETCIEESKYGKQEKESFDSLKQQMISMLSDTEKQLNEVAQKLQDQDYIDGLSPDGEQELKNRFQALSEELNRYQNQFYQVLNQAHMKLIHTMQTRISAASEVVAKDYKIPLILNRNAVFFYDEKYDITNIIVTQLDKTFETDQKLSQAETEKALSQDQKNQATK